MNLSRFRLNKLEHYLDRGCFPAPFRPRNPVTLPEEISKDKLSKAFLVASKNLLESFLLHFQT